MLKSNKKALLIAGTVILLCTVLLTGSTLALFTNDAADGKIGIITTTGDLEVDIVEAENTGNSLVGEVLNFQIDGQDTWALFEPGATFRTEGFKIKNSGESIPINFRLSVSYDIDMNMTEFNRAFEVWISTERDNPVAPSPISKFIGKLDAGYATSETYYLFIRMKSDAGNEFRGTVCTGLGVTVYASQGNVSIQEASGGS